jgi:hypothetical protein
MIVAQRQAESGERVAMFGISWFELLLAFAGVWMEPEDG